MHMLATLLALSFASASSDPLDDHAPFGFRAHEVYELGSGCADLESADLDGDGQADLALRVHDKLLIYLQE